MDNLRDSRPVSTAVTGPSSTPSGNLSEGIAGGSSWPSDYFSHFPIPTTENLFGKGFKIIKKKGLYVNNLKIYFSIVNK